MDGPDCCALLKVHTYREERLGQVLTGEAYLVVGLDFKLVLIEKLG